MPTRSVPMLAVAGALAVFAGCGNDGGEEQSAAPADTAAPSEQTQAKVSFTAPTEDQTVAGAVRARVNLSGFQVDPENVGKQPEQGKGHLHFSMDNGKFDKPKYSGANGKLAVKLGVDGKYSPAVAPQITYRNLPPGEHTLRVQLANNDHSPTGTETQTTFTIKQTQAKVSFTAPTEDQTVAGAVRARVNLSGFQVDPENVGKQPEQGKGHLHFSMDNGKFDKPKYSGANGKLAVKLGVDGKYSPAVAPQITYRNLPPGEHTLRVQLANNDHSPTGTEAETTFSVK